MKIKKEKKKGGARPKGKVNIKWSPDFAYAVGLLASDGHISKDGRHISFVSKDIEQTLNFAICLGINNKIGNTFGSFNNIATRIQFGDVKFVEFLNEIGITKAKSKTIGELKIPDEYFFDFLRGEFDGDGSTYSYWDKRWRSSFMYYLEFASASQNFIDWMASNILRLSGAKWHVTRNRRNSCLQLKFAKKSALIIIKKMYYSGVKTFLPRKRLKIDKMLGIVGQSV
ncbi:MAG: hypothetical protein NTV72_00950 [Candidatus Taylorbacteria bacterium]|nr:hypothetical protein [Candidatus Taylorbacteria bacterium]